jgi:hypothetical protein
MLDNVGPVEDHAVQRGVGFLQDAQQCAVGTADVDGARTPVVSIISRRPASTLTSRWPWRNRFSYQGSGLGS